MPLTRPWFDPETADWAPVYDACRTLVEVLNPAPSDSFVATKKALWNDKQIPAILNLDHARADTKPNIPAARRLRQVRIRPKRQRDGRTLLKRRHARLKSDSPKRRPAKAVRSPTRRVIFLHVTPTTRSVRKEHHGALRPGPPRTEMIGFWICDFGLRGRLAFQHDEISAGNAGSKAAWRAGEPRALTSLARVYRSRVREAGRRRPARSLPSPRIFSSPHLFIAVGEGLGKRNSNPKSAIQNRTPRWSSRDNRRSLSPAGMEQFAV
jgi:hypothetical protein